MRFFVCSCSEMLDNRLIARLFGTFLVRTRIILYKPQEIGLNVELDDFNSVIFNIKMRLQKGCLSLEAFLFKSKDSI